MSEIGLVRAAQLGDTVAFGAVIAGHRAEMTAVALRILRRPEDAADVVQDATLRALTRIGDLRDPEAVGPWLKQITRNASLQHLRGRRPVSLDDAHLERMATLQSEPDPAELVDGQAHRDWLWHAIDGLTPAHRTVVLLRHFTDVTEYEQIAGLLGVPVGTVRSRLSHARTRLNELLLAGADQAHDDHALRLARGRQQAEWTLSGIGSGHFAAALEATWDPAVELDWGSGLVSRGYRDILQATDQDLAEGVGCRLADVVVGRDVMIWTSDLINPPHDPHHCPPSSVWLLRLDGGRVNRFRQYHPRRPDSAPARDGVADTSGRAGADGSRA